MGSDLTTKILIEIRDELRGVNQRLDDANARIDDTNARLDDTNERLTILAKLTRSIDNRLHKIEEREPDRVFLPRRVDALEDRTDDHEARISALEED